jgi:hypothetical protein
LSDGQRGWRPNDPWDDLWENQGRANPLTLGRMLAAVTQALEMSPGARDLPFVIELHENTGARRLLMVSGISFTGTGDTPDGVTMTVVPGPE